MQKADLRIDYPPDLWEIQYTLKNVLCFFLSIVLHILLGGALWLSAPENARPFSDDVVDLTLSTPAVHLGSGAEKTLPTAKVKSSTPTDHQPTGSAERISTENAGEGEETGADTASGASPVGWGEVTRFPKVLNEIKALYPEEAKNAGVDGPVLMEILIDHTGKVRDVKVISGPEFGLKESAVAAIKKFEFQPAQKGSEPVAVKIRYTYRFKLGVN